MTEKAKGNVFIVAAPSGGGKTSLVRNLIDTLDNIKVSISHTTRPMRAGEQQGVDYFFVDEAQFMDMVNDNAFIEHARVFNYFYGTSSAQIVEQLNQGIDVLLDIDWQGAEQIRRIFPDAVSVFIVPPSLDALKQRLQNRGRDDSKVIEERMVKAQDEMSHYPEFDYLIVNDHFEIAAAELRSIVVSRRLQMKRQVIEQAKLLSFLLSSK